ncbi:MAG UNVERIFIED_CONTAM: hypothetical protein LVR18_51025 [Planctomycetaceae bacterium]|jgi:hypothetical protein
MTYWALGSADMVAVEFLHNLEAVQANGYFSVCAGPDSGLPQRTGSCDCPGG